jgi:uncharacterized protein
MTAEIFTSPLTALAAGFVTSAHCLGMCGPLACATTHREQPAQSAFLYHSGRLFSYAMAGGIFGWLGRSVAPLFNSAPMKALPIAFALFFLIVAFGWDKKIRLPRWIATINARILRRAQTLPKPTAALCLGLGTPFLPCAPLYLALGVALFSGSFAHGALLMTCFALGTIPALALLQVNWGWISGKLSPAWLRNIQRGLAFAAAALIIVRALSDVAVLAAHRCPMCH